MRIIFSTFLVFLILMGCGSSSRYINHRYQFSDTNFRNILISFKEDSTFLLRNSVSGSLSYSFIGKWKILNNRAILITNPLRDSLSSDKRDNAPPQGQKVNTILASQDPSYIFPIIDSDTIIFNRNFESFSLKGYPFKRRGKAKD